MGMKKTIIITLGLALSALAGLSQADEDRYSGGYIAAGIGTTAYADDDKLAAYDLDDNDWGWTVFGGYRFFRYLAVEVGYTNFGEFSAKGVFNDTDEKFQALYLAGVGILPLGESWQLHGKLGGGSIELDQSFSNQSGSDDKGGALLVGIGGQWAPVSLNGLAFNLNLDSYFITVEQNDKDYNQGLALLSLGVQYNF